MLKLSFLKTCFGITYFIDQFIVLYPFKHDYFAYDIGFKNISNIR